MLILLQISQFLPVALCSFAVILKVVDSLFVEVLYVRDGKTDQNDYIRGFWAATSTS
jgi:hypothetical protein